LWLAIDFLLLRQLSEEYTVVLEAVNDKGKIILASMYFDINRQIEDDFNIIEAIVQNVK